MLGGIGVGELGLILAAALLFFGAKRLPELARSVGGSIKAFKEGLKGDSGGPRASTSGTASGGSRRARRAS